MVCSNYIIFTNKMKSNIKPSESKYDVLDEILSFKYRNTKNSIVSVDSLVNFQKFFVVCINPIPENFQYCKDCLNIVPLFYSNSQNLVHKPISNLIKQ